MLNLALLLSAATAATLSPPPHIVILFADNMGWANVGWHKPPALEPALGPSTPHLDALLPEALELDRHYTYKFCSPSRSSLMTGRLPFHVNIYNDNPALPGAGVPTNMTMLPRKLKGAPAPYATHFIGKWHIGMASASAQTPKARGFDTSLAYFHSTNSYYDETNAGTHHSGCGAVPGAVDLFEDNGPARELNSSAYEERIFGARAVRLIHGHAARHGRGGGGGGASAAAMAPFFLYYAFHTSCVSPGDKLQPDPQFLARFPQIKDPDRRANVAMVALMDEVVGNITAALKTAGMWERTLLLWSSDNGGAVHEGGGANVWPLRGGYENNWEGGIRAAALLSGGFLPAAVRGTKLDGFIHECDWLATLCGLAGVPPEDAAARRAGLPPIDSLDVWPLISGANSTSPRAEWPLTPFGEDTVRSEHGGDAAYIAEGRYKLIVGERVQQAGWCGQAHPNRTKPWDSFKTLLNCSAAGTAAGATAGAKKVGCLFDVLQDPGEHVDLALTMPDKAAEIYNKMLAAERHWFDPDRGTADPRACARARETGFWGPFLP
eukprot:g2290.t1